MDEARPHSAAPAPRIVSPSPGSRVPPGGDADVTVATNAPDLPLELLLLSAEDPGAELARADIDPGAGSTSTHRIPIPADPGPDRPADYYLAVGVRAGFAAEQHRHVVPVTTRPAAG